MISNDKKLGNLVGYFYGAKSDFLEVGSLPQGSKLRLADGRQTKAKKKFAENGIPLILRPYCLTIWQGKIQFMLKMSIKIKNIIQILFDIMYIFIFKFVQSSMVKA